MATTGWLIPVLPAKIHHRSTCPLSLGCSLSPVIPGAAKNEHHLGCQSGRRGRARHASACDSWRCTWYYYRRRHLLAGRDTAPLFPPRGRRWCQRAGLHEHAADAERGLRAATLAGAGPPCGQAAEIPGPPSRPRRVPSTTSRRPGRGGLRWPAPRRSSLIRPVTCPRLAGDG
jgi:hypothetical protein